MQQTIGILCFVLFSGSVHGQNQTQPGATLPYYSGVPSGRIVNGQNVSIQNYPFSVGLLVNNFQICGGSIITAKHVVTAAHCLWNKPNITSVSVHAGSTSRYNGGYFFSVTSYVIHPNYNPQTIDYDAAIITIRLSFAGLKNVAAIGLQGADIAPTLCYAVGWGYTNYTTKAIADSLQYAALQLQSPSACTFAWSGFTAQMICAKNTNVYVCNGDSGGPLVCNNLLTGITSYGIKGCEGKDPAVFAKVASQSIRSFIRTNAGI